jgi:hypothetical protein
VGHGKAMQAWQQVTHLTGRPYLARYWQVGKNSYIVSLLKNRTVLIGKHSGQQAGKQ